MERSHTSAGNPVFIVLPIGLLTVINVLLVTVVTVA